MSWRCHYAYDDDDDDAGDMLTKILLQYLSFCSNGALCQCGSPRDSHASVTLNDYFSTAIVSHWDRSQHTSESPTDAFGEVEFAGVSKRHSYVGNHIPPGSHWKKNILIFFYTVTTCSTPVSKASK